MGTGMKSKDLKKSKELKSLFFDFLIFFDTSTSLLRSTGLERHGAKASEGAEEFSFRLLDHFRPRPFAQLGSKKPSHAIMF